MTESFAQREFGGADLGDRRLDALLVRMGTAAMARPDASLAQDDEDGCGAGGDLSFCQQPELRSEQVLAPHVRQTVRRCGRLQTVWVPHDTTDILYGGDSQRQNLGRVRGKKAGYEARVSIALQPAADARRMLGVLSVQRFNTGHGAAQQAEAVGGDKGDRWLVGVD